MVACFNLVFDRRNGHIADTRQTGEITYHLYDRCRLLCVSGRTEVGRRYICRTITLWCRMGEVYGVYLVKSEVYLTIPYFYYKFKMLIS